MICTVSNVKNFKLLILDFWERKAVRPKLYHCVSVPETPDGEDVSSAAWTVEQPMTKVARVERMFIRL